MWPGHSGPLPPTLRHQGLLHRSVRAHHPAQAHVQGGGQPWRRLLTSQPMTRIETQQRGGSGGRRCDGLKEVAKDAKRCCSLPMMLRTQLLKRDKHSSGFFIINHIWPGQRWQKLRAFPLDRQTSVFQNITFKQFISQSCHWCQIISCLRSRGGCGCLSPTPFRFLWIQAEPRMRGQQDSFNTCSGGCMARNVCTDFS